MYVCMYVCMYVYMYVCTYVRMSVRTYPYVCIIGLHTGQTVHQGELEGVQALTV